MATAGSRSEQAQLFESVVHRFLGEGEGRAVCGGQEGQHGQEGREGEEGGPLLAVRNWVTGTFHSTHRLVQEEREDSDSTFETCD